MLRQLDTRAERIGREARAVGSHQIREAAIVAVFADQHDHISSDLVAKPSDTRIRLEHVDS